MVVVSTVSVLCMNLALTDSSTSLSVALFFSFFFFKPAFLSSYLIFTRSLCMTLKKKPRDSFSSNLLCHDHLFNRPMFIAALAVIIFSSMEGPDMERATIMAFLCNSIYPVR